MSERFCEVAKVGVFCDSVTHSTEKRKDGEVKVVVLSLRVQPFDAKLATAVRPVMRSTLFKLNHPDPHPHLKRVDFAIDVPRQQLVVFSTPDTVKASIAFDQVKISGLYARGPRRASTGSRWSSRRPSARRAPASSNTSRTGATASGF